MYKYAIVALSIGLSSAVGCGSSGPNKGGATGPKTGVSDPKAQGPQAADAGGHAGSGAADASPSAKAPDAGSAGSAGQGASAAGSGADADGGASANPAATALADLPDALATSVCAAIDSCVGAAVLRELTEHEDCTVRVAAQLRATEFAFIEQSVSSDRVAYDPSQLPACLDDIRGLGCDVLSHTLPPSCSAVLDGQVQIDGECAISSECHGAAFCAGADQCPSHCAPLLSEGDACSGDNQCGDDLTCAGGQCVRPSLEGEPCNGNSGTTCRIGFTCQGSTDVDPGSCVPNAMVQIGNEGDSCEPGGSLCKDGLSCVYASGSEFHCESAVGSGASCHLGLPGQCPNDEYCDTTEVTAQSTCRKLPGEGQACVLTGRCAPGLVCVAEGQDHNCRAIEDNCGACSDDAACRSGNCDQGKCAPPPACGEAFVCP